MTLYLKAGPDGTSPGDCPFAHYVRMVLEEKGLEYELRPSTAETKPSWLLEHYGGKMPALRHRKECYVESDVIADYLDFFFQDPPLKAKGGNSREASDEAEAAIEGIFPAIAKYLKHTPDGDAADEELRSNLEGVLSRLEEHLKKDGRTGPYLVGDGEKITLLDCGLAPKLYHMQVGLEAFKGNAVDVSKQFPAVQRYMDAAFGRESFKKTVYPKETLTWGWGNARSS